MKNIFVVMLLVMFTSCSSKVQKPDIQKYLKENPSLISKAIAGVEYRPEQIKIKTWKLKAIHESMQMPFKGTARNDIYWPVEIDVNYKIDVIYRPNEYKETKKAGFYIDGYGKPQLERDLQ